MKSRTKPALLAIGVALVIVMSLGGCAGRQGSSASEGQNAQDSASAAATSSGEATEQTPTSGENMLYTPAYKPNGKEVAVIKTSKGTITAQLYGAEAPIAVGSFIELARKGFYDGVKFHRLEPGFVIQGGDPQTKSLTSDEVKSLVERQKRGVISSGGEPVLGTGGPGYVLKGEFAGNTHKHVDGTLAAARAQSPDSAGSQFYFTLGAQSFLDGQYTVFGQADEASLEVVHQLGVGDVIESITIQNLSQ